MIAATDALQRIFDLALAGARAVCGGLQGLSPEELFALLGVAVVLLIVSRTIRRLALVVLALVFLYWLAGGVLDRELVARGWRTQ